MEKGVFYRELFSPHATELFLYWVKVGWARSTEPTILPWVSLSP